MLVSANDGLRNIVEYAFGGNSLVANFATGPFRPRLVMVDEGGKRYSAIRFRCHRIRRSAATIEMPPTDLGNDLEDVTIRSNTDEATSFKMFFRTSVRQSP